MPIVEQILTHRSEADQQGINLRNATPTLEPFFTDGMTDPSSQVVWDDRDAKLIDSKGKCVSEYKGLRFPKFWSPASTQIVADKYLRFIPTLGRKETSVDEMLERVVGWYRDEGEKDNYFDSEHERNVFGVELKHLLLNQLMAFNSPVWFNVGIKERPRVSACFILDVEDNMASILNWYREEGLVFKQGSGAGINLSNLRGSCETLSTGGTASGPVSFMRGADASAGAIRSGGATRRAAKMVVLDCDHPDVEEFIECKAREEEKARALTAAGFDMGLDGRDKISLQYQNANNSVGLKRGFMEAYKADKDWNLTGVRDGKVKKTLKAQHLMRKIAKAAWDCADPGVFYLDNMNDWHTSPSLGPIRATNPCGEFVRPHDTSCNLASLRLTKFYDPETQTFDVESFIAAVRVTITAMDISVSNAEYPTPAMTETVNRFRELGLGFTDLGALLMQMGLPYSSQQGRNLAALLTAIMTGAAYKQSALLAAKLGAYPGWTEEGNADAHLDVIRKHKDALSKVECDGALTALYLIAEELWDSVLFLGEAHGFRNAQVSLVAPTGTISFMMDAATTGIEPDFALVKYKKMIDGSLIKIVNPMVPVALKVLGYDDKAQKAISDHIYNKGSTLEAPGLKDDHQDVFSCAVGPNAIHYKDHIRMMAAVQPFISGAISKTVNLPNDVTVSEIESIYVEGHELGLKNIALYRDGCKSSQPLTTSTDGEKEEAKPLRAKRLRLPAQRRGTTTSFKVDGCDGYIRTGEFPDGSLGEIFVDVSKQGSTLSGLMDVFAISISLGLQHGVPLEAYVEKFVGQKFAPAGITNDPDFSIGQSLPDYLFRRLAADYLPEDTRHKLNIKTNKERTAEVGAMEGRNQVQKLVKRADAPLCVTCGVAMRAAGSCFCCEECGASSGCS